MKKRLLTPLIRLLKTHQINKVEVRTMSIRDEMNKKLNSSMLTTYEEVQQVFMDRCEKISKRIFEEFRQDLLQKANNAQNNLSKKTIEVISRFSLGYMFKPDSIYKPSSPFLFNDEDTTDPEIIKDFCSLPEITVVENVVTKEDVVEKGFIFKHKKIVRTQNIETKRYLVLPLSYILFLNKLKEDAAKFDEKSEFIIEAPFVGTFVDNETYKILLKSNFYVEDESRLEIRATLKYRV